MITKLKLIRELFGNTEFIIYLKENKYNVEINLGEWYCFDFTDIEMFEKISKKWNINLNKVEFSFDLNENKK